MAGKEEKTRLDLNWDDVFPGEEIDIAGCRVPIKPLGVRKLAEVMKKVKTIGNLLKEAGITWENYNQRESLVTLTSIVLERCPEVISEASNIQQEDIDRLPIEYQVLIVAKVLEVNAKSRDVLEKNFESLAKTLANLMSKKKSEK